MKDDLKNMPIALGTWISTGSPIIAELVCQFAFDWLLIDIEHGNTSEVVIPDMLRATKNSTVKTIVRVPGLEPSLIARVLDWGATGIMLPHVSTPEEASRCVAAMRYPPRGIRGFSSSVRAYGYGTRVPQNLKGVNPLLFAQIENIAGVNNSQEIAAVDGVDVLFVGPADLKLSLNMLPETETLNFDTAIEKIAHTAKTSGKQAGILLRDHHQLDSMKSMGFSYIAIDSEVGILRTEYERIVNYPR